MEQIGGKRSGVVDRGRNGRSAAGEVSSGWGEDPSLPQLLTLDTSSLP